ncbi:hypothetical protein ACP3TG_21135 [Phytobacter diazotrophicus]
MSKELSGAAGDVLHALFFRGALVDGDLPSKSGVAELRELGYVMTKDTATAFGGDNHYNFLTPAGQEFAISYLVDSRFGKKPCTVRELVIKTSVDASELQSTIDVVLESIRKSDVFKILSGQTFINNAPISGGIMSAPDSNLETWRHEVQCRFDQQSASIASLQVSIGEMVKDAIRRELQPGGLLYARK